jgi:UDP-glucose 4-epimerase
VHAAPRPGEVRHSLAAIDAAREDLGYQPVIGLREGLQRTVAAFERESIEVPA